MGFPQDFKPPQRPLLFNLSASSLAEEAARLVAERNELFDKITHEVRPDDATVQNTLLPIIQGENYFLVRRRAIRFYSSTSPSLELRDASAAANKSFDHSDVNLFLRSDVFKLVDAVKRKYGGTLSHPELDHYLTKFHRDFLIKGCALEGAAKEEFREGKKKLTEMERQIILNLDEGNAGIWLSREELEGVPNDFIEKQKKGEGEHAGMLWVSLKRLSFSHVLRYASRESTRRKIWTFNQNRLPGNVTLHRDIVLHRDKLARLLGFSSHMAMKTTDGLAETPGIVAAFLDQMKSLLVPDGRKEIDQLLKLKLNDAPTAADGAEQAIFFWDTEYYERIQIEKQGSLNLKFVTEYFEVWNTLKELMAIYEHIFDLEFEPVTSVRGREILGDDFEYMVWQEDVRPFIVWDKKLESFIGYMYFDLFPRPGKYSHAGHYSLQPSYIQPDGSRFHASGAIVMNYPIPAPGKPSFLTLDQTRSLFHEMGHGMHHLLSETQTARFHGTAVEKDFVETPSIMFEYFLWTPRHIKGVSRHYAQLSPAYAESWRALNPDKPLPAEKLPDTVVEDLLSANASKKRLHILRQLHFATYDMMVHNPTSHEELESASLAEWFNKSRTELTGLKGGEHLGEGWEWAQGQSVLRLLNGDGYSGAQYAYFLGPVWAYDIFDSTFAKDTMSKEAGRRYRNGILRVGGTQPGRKTLTEYLGRESSPKAYNSWLGLGPPTQVASA